MLAAASLLVALAAAAGAGATALDRASLATAWLCLLLLGATLLVGPRQARRTGRPVTNHLLRRDLGIWCAINGLVHLGIAFAISMTPLYMASVVDAAPGWPGLAPRQLYLWAVSGSLVIAAIFVLLLGLSSNRALRRLGPRWWKRLQRASYLAFLLTVAHAAVFQRLEGRAWPLVLLLAGVAVAVLAGQWLGWRAVRRARWSPGHADGKAGPIA